MSFSNIGLIPRGRTLLIVWLMLTTVFGKEYPALAENSLPLLTMAVTPLTNSRKSVNSCYDFGSLCGFQSLPLSHVFDLQNHMPIPQKITELRPTCGCTYASISGGTSLPLVLQPGQSLSVRVVVDVTLLPPGPFDKPVWVLVQGQDAPIATLTLAGTLLPAARFSPDHMNFGRVSADTPTSQVLKVALAANLLPAGSVPRLVCFNPDIQIGSGPVGASDTKTTSTTLTNVKPTSIKPDSAKTSLAQSYRVTLLPHAHLGQITGKVDVVVTAPGGKDVTVGSVPLQGEVVGDVAASPSLVAFGTATVGKAAMQQIMLTTQGSQTLRVSSTSPYLSAHLEPALAGTLNRPFPGTSVTAAPISSGNTSKPSNPAQMHLLDITLSPNTPAGPLETSLTVTTGTGQQLVVPVFALVQKAVEQESVR